MKLETAAVLAAIWAFVKGLLPGAFGAAVAVSFDHTASFAHKLAQFLAGIVVSYFVANVIHEVTDFGPMVQQSISFTTGMIAYNSVRAFAKSAEVTAGEIPGDLWEWLRDRLPGGRK